MITLLWITLASQALVVIYVYISREVVIDLLSYSYVLDWAVCIFSALVWAICVYAFNAFHANFSLARYGLAVGGAVIIFFVSIAVLFAGVNSLGFSL